MDIKIDQFILLSRIDVWEQDYDPKYDDLIRMGLVDKFYVDVRRRIEEKNGTITVYDEKIEKVTRSETGKITFKGEYEKLSRYFPTTKPVYTLYIWNIIDGEVKQWKKNVQLGFMSIGLMLWLNEDWTSIVELIEIDTMGYIIVRLKMAEIPDSELVKAGWKICEQIN